MAIMEMLSNRNVHVVSRGYGGSEAGPIRVNEANHRADQVGDEPLLLSAFGPVWVSKDRAAGAKAAKAAGADIILLDDGFQNPSLTQTLSILVVDAETGFGNGRVIPAGPLREPIEAGLARADALIAIGPLKARDDFFQRQKISIPTVQAELKPLQTGMDWKDLNVIAFAGIGRPQKFYDSLENAGANIVSTRSFGDHAPYRADLLKRLLSEAKAKNAQLVTTEKDAVRLPNEMRSQVLTFPVRLQFDDSDAFQAILKAAQSGSV